MFWNRGKQHTRARHDAAFSHSALGEFNEQRFVERPHQNSGSFGEKSFFREERGALPRRKWSSVIR